MELLDTIPVYSNPMWLTIVWLVIVAIFVTTIFAHNEGTAEVIVSICSFIATVICTILLFTDTFAYYDHDEYVVRLTDMSATDFFKDYEIVKIYEYSDAWRVKKKDGVK